MGFVQSAHNTASGANSVTVTMGSSPTVGDCLIGMAGVEASSSNTVSSFKSGGVADNWASAVARNTTGTDGTGAAIWTDQDLQNTSTSVVAAFGASGPNGAYVIEWAGIIASSAVDKTDSAAVSSSTSFNSGTTAALAQAAEVAFGFVFTSIESPTTTFTPPGAYTNLTALAPSSGAGGVGGYQQVSATTGLNYAGTSSATMFVGQALIATLKLSTAGPAPFTAPSSARKTTPAARRGAAAGSPGAPVTAVGPGPIAPFTAPNSAVRGRQLARRDGAQGGLGAPVRPQPARPVPQLFSGGHPAARRGRAAGSAAPPPVQPPTIPAPFTAPHAARRGRQLARRGAVAGSIGAPVKLQARQLLISLASKAGTDDYGNAILQGIFAAAGIIKGPVFEGADFIITSQGAFFYSGTPGVGNLILSISASTVTFTDPFGNQCVPLTGWYGGGFFTQIGAGFITFGIGSLSAGWTANSSMQCDSSGNLYLGATASIFANGNLIS